MVGYPDLRRTHYGRSSTRQRPHNATPRVRAELQASQEATSVLAVRYGLNPKTALMHETAASARLESVNVSCQVAQAHYHG
jgi:hypothetical protein